MIFAAWLSELILESSGAFFAFRRQLQPLAWLLGFRALADILTFLTWKVFGDYAYAWSHWACYAVQLVLLCWLAAGLAGKLLRTRKRLLRLSLFASVLGGIVVGFVFNRGETWMGRFLDAQISASCWLAILVLCAWFAKAGKLEKPWPLIAAGLVVSIAGNAFCALLWQAIPQAQYWYPVPAIAALLIWNWAGFGPWKLDEVRVPHSAKKPPTSIWVPRKVQARKF